MAAKQAELPPVMILCGGKGTRLRDIAELLPKPMVPIGEHPVLWHIMRGFAAFGCRRFILCLGYKREEFIDYFLNFQARSCDMTITLGKEQSIVYHGSSVEADWEITLADTGIETMTGGRVLRASRYLKSSDQDFFLTYGDGVADIDVAALLNLHRRHGKLLTVSAVHPEGRFGEMQLDNHGEIIAFTEKKVRSDGWVNGGFMAVKHDFIDRYLAQRPDCYFEQRPMAEALHDGQMAVYQHHGFWQCMDTPREHRILNELWESGNPPWCRYWQVGE